MSYCNACGGTIVVLFDNVVKCEYCGKLYINNDGELKESNFLAIYDKAVNLSKTDDEMDLENAIELLEALGSYKDSAKLANSLRERISNLKIASEERKLEEKRRTEQDRIRTEKIAFEEKQKAKAKKKIIGCAVIAGVVITISFSLIHYSKVTRYNKATQLFADENYEEAVTIFESIDSYSDSSTYVDKINSILEEQKNKYNMGITYFQKEAYVECIGQLVDIVNYEDASEYFDQACEKVREQAANYYDQGDYNSAKELLDTIPEARYTNVDYLRGQVDEKLLAQKKATDYELAQEYYVGEQYDLAQKVFIELGDYEESANYLSAIGNSYFEQAKTCFSNGDYINCGNLLLLIDTQEEWSEYTQAIELKNNASAALYDAVATEAKNICRRDGYDAMSGYIDSMQCALLDETTAADMKEACNVKSVWLQDMNAMEVNLGNEFFERSDKWGTLVTSNMGETLSYEIIMLESSSKYGNHYAVYAIDKQYTVLSGTVSIAAGCNVTPWLEFWGDGNKLGETIQFTKTTRPYDFEIDVTGVSDLKIVARCGTSAGTDPYLLTDGFKLTE